MEIKAYAKINLALDVVTRRVDGYHELDMIMTPITLYDTLSISLAETDSFSCKEYDLTFDESNTIYRAIELMRNLYNIKEHFKIELVKNIPMQAGLAGGSADAAAMLRAIQSLCNLNVSEQELINIGVQIGADVPFCLTNKLCRVKGIGEKMVEIQTDLNPYVLLVKPESGVSTKQAFEMLDFNKCVHPDVEKIEQLLIENNNEFANCLDNTLEESALKINADIKQVKTDLLAYDFDKVLMSGSGSTVFALSNDLKKLKQAEQELSSKYPFVCLCEMKSKGVS